MKKILLPTDLSELGNFAYDLAHKVAQKKDAEIHVISIVPAPPNAVFDADGNIKTDEGHDISAYIQQKIERSEKMDQWCSNKPDIKSCEVKIGRLEEDVLHYAKKNDIELIVMGTTGAGGMKELISGSNAQKIVRQSHCPVLTLKCDRSGMKEIKDMLLAYDFRRKKKINLDMVKELQETFGAKLHLLKINTPKNFEPQRKAMAKMFDFSEKNQLENVEFHLYSDNSIEEGIANFCADSGIDFLMMGTKQRTGLSRLFKHSVSEGVVNHLWQPILTFPI